MWRHRGREARIPGPEDPASGRWKECIGQRRRLFRNKEVSQLSTGMHIFAILTQTIYVSSPFAQIPKWMERGYRNTVKTIKYNHLQQTQAMEVVPRRTVHWPKDNTIDENSTRLQDYLQGHEADTVFDDKKQMVKPRGSPRGDCNLCYSLMSASGKSFHTERSSEILRKGPICKQTDVCEYDANTLSCWRCQAFNRPCTWTTKATGPDTTYTSGLSKSTIDLLASGGPLEGLGIPIVFHRAAKMAKSPQEMVWTIDPPFAMGIESNIAEEY